MRLGPIIHGSLLLVALLFAYQTSTRKKDTRKDVGSHSMWNESGVQSIHFETEKRAVKVERRSDAQGDYLWAVVTTTKTVKKKVEPDSKEAQEDPATEASGSDAKEAGAEDKPAPEEAGSEAAKPEPKEVEEQVVSTKEFPVGEKGDELFAQYQELRAMREVGSITNEDFEKYGLHENTINLTVLFDGDKERSLVLAGKNIYNGKSRYVLDVSTNKAYVLSASLIDPLFRAEDQLSIKQAHAYDKELVKSVLVTTSAGDKEINHISRIDHKGERKGWSEGGSQEPDQTLDNFLDRVSKLHPGEYHPEMESERLNHIATFRYRDEKKGALGYLELYREHPDQQEADPKATVFTQYYMRSERTRVLAKVGRINAEKVDQDLVELFGISPAPAAIRPASNPPPALLTPPPEQTPKEQTPKESEAENKAVPPKTAPALPAPKAAVPKAAPKAPAGTMPAPKGPATPATPAP